MKKRELKNLRKKYIDLRESLIKIILNSDFEVDVAGDDIDKLQGASLLRVQNKLSQNNLKKLNAIDKAIEQIDIGDYGECEECGENIGIKRLEALPGITTCISCAEKSEFINKNLR